jgi:hypothetical protein
MHLERTFESHLKDQMILDPTNLNVLDYNSIAESSNQNTVQHLASFNQSSMSLIDLNFPSTLGMIGTSQKKDLSKELSSIQVSTPFFT